MSDRAATLRALHVPGTPVVLPNAWDAPSAGLIEAAGFPALATSSAAVARALGSEDHEALTADEALAAAKRMVDAGSVPVTVDFEGGYGLAPDAIAFGLLGVGAAGCNFEDTDHRGPGPLVDAETQAARIAAVRAAAGDGLVINARVDTFARRVPNALEEAIERGRRYLDAGADCIYPITASDEIDIAALVDALGVININLGPASPSLARMAELGVARVSTASGLHRVMTKQVGAVLTALRDGDDSLFREGS
jgi:2-methylisocitrate lyase-like PEP mutase family enzyme